ncbi:MAG TPA: glutamate--tRNA ligase [Gemmatimonadaceae bacterium]|nr:glutamate--tRNA ligase [Gemmatimonadaceae bacterium]
MTSTLPTPLRLRFAPSPTGYLHVGGARTALYNWLLARKHGGTFLLRIEDTDRARSTDESTHGIFEGMEWLGLTWDEEVTYQGANLARHQHDAARLLEAGAVYRCFCTAAELDQRRAEAESRGDAFKYDRRCDQLTRDEIDQRVADGVPFVLRFRVPDGTTEWDDLVHERIAFPNKDIEDFVVLRSDATPIYNLAVVSDDIASAITVVMRGDDHISNTPKQILLYRALGAPLPVFAHLPMIHGTDGKKLSKRHGAMAVGDYRHEGILPSAMVNFLALLGWSPGDDREVMMRPELIERFEEHALLKKASVFDTKKLEWMNGQHLNILPLAEVEPLITPAMVGAGYASTEWFATNHDWYAKLLDLLRVRARTVDEVVRQAAPYFGESVTLDPDAVAKQWNDAATVDVLAGARDALASVSDWSAEPLEDALRSVAEARGIGAGKLFQPLRVALTGSAVSPGIFDVLTLLGRDRSLARIDAGLRTLRAR